MAAFIMSGMAQAIGFTLMLALLSFFLPPLGIFANAAVALVALRLGLKQGILVAAGASLGLGIVTLLQGSLLVGFGAGMADWVPLVLLALVLGATISWSTTLQYLFGLIVVLILLFHMVVGDVAAFWQNLITLLLQALTEAGSEIANFDELKASMLSAAPYLTGGLAAILSIHWLTSLMLARHWQSELYNPGGFQRELHNIRVTRISALILVTAIAFTLLTSSLLATDIVVAGIAVFVFAGVSLVHYLVKTWKLPMVVLVFMYILLLFQPKYMGILLASFAIIDSQADFRRHFGTQESEH